MSFRINFITFAPDYRYKIQKNHLYMNIIESIKKMRKHKGISPEYIADHLNISQSAYHKIEVGETELTTD